MFFLVVGPHMDYPRRILFQRKPPRWWSFLAKSGVDLVLIGRDFVVNRSIFYFGADSLSSHGVRASDGRFDVGCSCLKSGKGAPEMWPPKLEKSWIFSNSPLACKSQQILCLHFFLTPVLAVQCSARTSPLPKNCFRGAFFLAAFPREISCKS